MEEKEKNLFFLKLPKAPSEKLYNMYLPPDGGYAPP